MLLDYSDGRAFEMLRSSRKKLYSVRREQVRCSVCVTNRSRGSSLYIYQVKNEVRFCTSFKRGREGWRGKDEVRIVNREWKIRSGRYFWQPVLHGRLCLLPDLYQWRMHLFDSVWRLALGLIFHPGRQGWHPLDTTVTPGSFQAMVQPLHLRP